ncbi:uncharacterized protein FOMMEDRAFT_110379 [Fomitiporia mediterranea MF3/22]|uniref:uncharacterized protein n=1 Tax=Fomitiporia mediterranea (strain MF3/22) TaxID=694068 RepID=UPI0004407796|nr:uncharacterized protein FOMMEDRAFT_110379 [Fomitiporia mediterranea MF3/22]EJD00942.1 hypothetical protein FOMMEDRAFT_110379 [Fomitiporia mediterranea MF3/22]
MAGVSELRKSLGLGEEPEMTPPPGLQVPIEQIWENMLNQLKELSSATVEKNVQLTRRVSQLEEELSVWKQARSVTINNAEKTKQQYEDERAALQKRINILESMQNSMVLCVLDGDGNIFANHLLAAGLEGGREAARSLTGGIWDYMKAQGYEGQPRFTFWLSIYFNRKGLQETLVRNNVCTVDQFDAFLVGFSQASPRFNLIDVGYGKEAADAKIKEYLQTYTRFPQTLKVFFGGGHDNGYLPTLSALENERFLDKIILLKGYRDVATELRALNMQTLSLEDLFRNVKLNGPSNSNHQRAVVSPAPSEAYRPLISSPVKTYVPPPIIDSLNRNNDGPSVQKQILIDSNLPLSKQKPPPCNEYYLLKRCPRGETCKYGHSYALTGEMIAELARQAKKALPHIILWRQTVALCILPSKLVRDFQPIQMTPFSAVLVC